MAQWRYYYSNLYDLCTITKYSSQLSGLPASNTQNISLSKKWRTGSGFVISTSVNDVISFKYTSTTSISTYQTPANTYTGSSLASVLQSGLRSVSVYNSHTVLYDSSSEKFTIAKGASGTTFELWFNNNSSTSISSIAGWDRQSSYSGTNTYVSSGTTLGNQHFIEFSNTSVFTANSLIIDNTNLSSGTVLTLRVATSTSKFAGLYNWSGAAPTGTSTFTFSLIGNRSVFPISSNVSNKAIQLHWIDRSLAYSEMGRIWLSVYFQPENHIDDEISYSSKTVITRSDSWESESGITYFNKKNKLHSHAIRVEDLDKYYNSSTLSGYKTLINSVGNDRCFYVSFNSDNISSNTIYGYMTNTPTFHRMLNTTVFKLSDIQFKEQK